MLDKERLNDFQVHTEIDFLDSAPSHYAWGKTLVNLTLFYDFQVHRTSLVTEGCLWVDRRPAVPISRKNGRPFPMPRNRPTLLFMIFLAFHVYKPKSHRFVRFQHIHVILRLCSNKTRN